MEILQAKPIVKWAGGKQALAELIVKRFPCFSGRYFEPFLGGASVFLAAMPQKATLNDSNGWLIQTYEAIRDDEKRVAKILESLPNTKADYLRIRDESRTVRSEWKRAAYFVYLNKTCFRGLYRVNQKNHFNVPYGDYDRRYFDPENFEAFSASLKDTILLTGDFELSLHQIRSSDFVYFDPPYYKIGGYSDFNRYTPDQFRESDHIRLAALCRELDHRGVPWLVSNSDTPFVRELFNGFLFEEITNRREINLKSKSRSVTELLISNFDTSDGV